MNIGPNDTGDGQGAVLNLAAELNPPTTSPAGTCDLPINTGGTHWVLDAALHWTNKWVSNGILPPEGQQLHVSSVSPVVFAKDANGNTAGGVRSVQVDAPIADFTGIGNTPLFCVLFGTTTPFSNSQMESMYPTHGSFVSQWSRAAAKEVKAGFLLPADAEELVDSAATSNIGS